MSPDSRQLRAALAYAQRFGFPVFPCRPRAKEPLTQHGFKEATRDPAQIRAWWKHWPTANVGLPTGVISEILVFDIDPRHDGHQSLVRLVEKYGELTITPTVLTGGDGRHYYFRANEEAQIRNSAGALGPGLDVRGEGGYVIAPPSVHPSGQRYRWEPGSRIDELELAPLPSWLSNLLVRPHIGPAANKTVLGPPRRTTGGLIRQLDLTQMAAGVPEGQRDERLFRLACHLRWRGYPREQAEQILIDAAGRCRPPFPIATALRKVDSAWRCAQ